MGIAPPLFESCFLPVWSAPSPSTARTCKSSRLFFLPILSCCSVGSVPKLVYRSTDGRYFHFDGRVPGKTVKFRLTPVDAHATEVPKKQITVLKGQLKKMKLIPDHSLLWTSRTKPSELYEFRSQSAAGPLEFFVLNDHLDRIRSIKVPAEEMVNFVQSRENPRSVIPALLKSWYLQYMDGWSLLRIAQEAGPEGGKGIGFEYVTQEMCDASDEEDSTNWKAYAEAFRLLGRTVNGQWEESGLGLESASPGPAAQQIESLLESLGTKAIEASKHKKNAAFLQVSSSSLGTPVGASDKISSESKPCTGGASDATCGVPEKTLDAFDSFEKTVRDPYLMNRLNPLNVDGADEDLEYDDFEQEDQPVGSAFIQTSANRAPVSTDVDDPIVPHSIGSYPAGCEKGGTKFGATACDAVGLVHRILGHAPTVTSSGHASSSPSPSFVQQVTTMGVPKTFFQPYIDLPNTWLKKGTEQLKLTDKTHWHAPDLHKLRDSLVEKIIFSFRYYPSNPSASERELMAIDVPFWFLLSELHAFRNLTTPDILHILADRLAHRLKTNHKRVLELQTNNAPYSLLGAHASQTIDSVERNSSILKWLATHLRLKRFWPAEIRTYLEVKGQPLPSATAGAMILHLFKHHPKKLPFKINVQMPVVSDDAHLEFDNSDFRSADPHGMPSAAYKELDLDHAILSGFSEHSERKSRISKGKVTHDKNEL
eukprot:GHVT01048791.1.p1 GENE.GHVT01048791.1~~GHVT01048791.1.p1  ORF type:complete len:709 (-),score=86.75 GHVT01048791.1:444-2570(-)